MVKRFDTGELGREGIVLCGEFVLASDYDTLESRTCELEAALRDIAVGFLPEDGAAGDQQRYVLCASRLCAIARNAIRKI